jgi:transcriptional regulator of heat shock response
VYQFIRDNGGFDNWDIVLIENVVGCSDSPTLHARERYWIETLHAELNKNIPTRTRNEYREENKELIAETTKKYEELNRNKKKEYDKKYRELNQDKIIIKNEKYNKKRRELRAMKKLAQVLK